MTCPDFVTDLRRLRAYCEQIKNKPAAGVRGERMRNPLA